MTTYQRAAMISLDTMKTVWKGGNAFRSCTGGGCFWMAGNFFHTALDAMYQLQVKDAYGFGLDALKFFDDSAPKGTDPRKWPTESGIWVDDYGWWGIALTMAYRYADALGYDAETKQKFAVRAQNCWEAMNSFWQTSSVSWDIDGAHYSVSGGVPNTLDTAPTLAGRNCVTNEVYWALSNMLFANFGDHYKDPNALASDFFRQGYEQRILFNSKNLVYVRLYGMPGSTHHDWTWLGDQGLFAYSSFFNSTGNEKLFGQEQGQLVLDAVKNNMKTASGVLHEDLAPWSQYIMDYACGKGTFMRYLSYINSYLHGAFPGLSKYDEYISINARAVWKNRSQTTNQFGFYWDGEGTAPKDWGYRQDTADAILQAAGFTAIIGALAKYADQPIDQVSVEAGAV